MSVGALRSEKDFNYCHAAAVRLSQARPPDFLSSRNSHASLAKLFKEAIRILDAYKVFRDFAPSFMNKNYL